MLTIFSSKGSFVCTIPQNSHVTAYATPVGGGGGGGGALAVITKNSLMGW